MEHRGAIYKAECEASKARAIADGVAEERSQTAAHNLYRIANAWDSITSALRYIERNGENTGARTAITKAHAEIAEAKGTK